MDTPLEIPSIPEASRASLVWEGMGRGDWGHLGEQPYQASVHSSFRDGLKQRKMTRFLGKPAVGSSPVVSSHQQG